jgi:hypothetical protein
MDVLVIEFYPLTSDRQNIDISVTGDVGGPAPSIRERVADLNAKTVDVLTDGTRYLGHSRTIAPSLAYRIVDTIRYDDAVPTVPYEIGGTPYSVRPDYMSILRDVGICSLVSAGIDEVWIQAYQGPSQLALTESNMSGPYGDISNSYHLDDLPDCGQTYVVYDFNYGRTDVVGHNHGHQLERVFMHFDRQLFDRWWGLDSSFVPPRVRGETGRCGSVHAPPNGDEDYDYTDTTPWPSDCLDWNPDGLGSTTQISCSVWGCGVDAQTNYLTWWMQNIPGAANDKTYGGEQLRNWWQAHSDFDRFAANEWDLSIPNPDLQPSVTLDVPDVTDSFDVPVSLTVTDPAGAGISGYMVSTDGSTPTSEGDPRWQASEPVAVRLPFGSDGSRTFYA